MKSGAWKVRVGAWAMAAALGMSGALGVAMWQAPSAWADDDKKDKKKEEEKKKKEEEEKKIKQTKETLERVKGMVNQYFQNNLRLPESLDQLTKEPNPVTGSVPSDAWGKALKYRMGEYSFEKQEFDVMSDGPDGKSGTSDDIKVSNSK